MRFGGRRRFFEAVAATLTSVACGCVRVPERPTTLATGTGQASTLPDQFEVVCWNIHKNADAAAAVDGLAPGAELALLQESATTTGVPAGHAIMVVAFRRARDERPAGVMTISRAVPNSSTALLSDTREPFVRTPKSSLVTMIPLARGGVLLVANVHGVNFRNADALAGQLRELDPLLSVHRGPVIVAGDFNTWSRARRDVVSAFTERHALASVFVGEDAPRLDAIFYRGLRPENSVVISNRHSDHDALRVRFVLSPVP